ncbi:MAG: hypothetical protein V4726_03085 [Verrucomicrobiota bacterium]
MSDSEPLPRRPHSRARPWLEAAAVGGLLIAANLITAPRDPGWLSLNPSPWLLLPVLTGLRHGFRWGFLFGTAASLAVFSVLWVLHPGAAAANLIFFLSLPAAGLAAGGACRPPEERAPEKEMEPPSRPAGILTAEQETPAAPLAEHAEILKTLTAQRDHLLARLAEQELAAQNRLLEADGNQTRRAEETDRMLHQHDSEREALTARIAEAGETIRLLTADRRGLTDQLEQLSGQLEQRALHHARLTEQMETLGARLSGKDETIQSLRLALARQEEAVAAAAEEEAREEKAVTAAAEEEETDAEAPRARSDKFENRLAVCLDSLREITAGRDELAARLEERDRLLKSLGEEHGLLTARLADRETALRRTGEQLHALNVLLADRKPPPESMIARTPPPFRRLPGRNGVRRIHTTEPPEAPDADTAADTLVPDESEPSGQLPEMPPSPHAGADAGAPPLEARLRALFDPGSGAIFSNLLTLLADVAGVADAAVYQIDGSRLHRAALQGSGGMLPKTLPLAGAEIAHLAVTRQSFVTCRQVWATVPAQDSPWLAAMPWPTDGFHSSAVVLIHRMHAGSVNWRTFSLIQMICRWAALFMKLHRLKGTGTEAADGPPVVAPEVLRRAAMDAAAAHREQGAVSSSVMLRLAPEAAATQSGHLLRTIRPQLRPTDLLALHPPGGAASGGHDGGAGPWEVEVLLTFSDKEDADVVARRLTGVIRADPALQAAVSVGIPVQIGAPSRN